MTKQETNKLLAMALASWPVMQDKGIKIEVTATVWHRMLSHLTYEQADAGLAKLVMTSRFFPTVAEILEAVESVGPQENRIPSPDEAWDEVCRNLDPYRLPEWSHEAIKKTVQRLGSIRLLCETENLSVVRAHFFKLYELLLAKEKETAINKRVVALVTTTAKLKSIS